MTGSEVMNVAVIAFTALCLSEDPEVPNWKIDEALHEIYHYLPIPVDHDDEWNDTTCPECGEHVNGYYDQYCCPKCRKRLDWSEWDEWRFDENERES